MGQMKDAVRGLQRLTEKFYNKTEDSVTYHVKRVDLAVVLFPEDAEDHERQDDDVEADLDLARRPPGPVRAGDALAEAAAGEQAVDPRAQQGEDHADREDVEDVRRFALGELRQQEVEDRHEEDRAEQTQHAEVMRFSDIFKFRERDDRGDAEDRMQDRQRRGGVPLEAQLIAVYHRPDERERRAREQQQKQRDALGYIFSHVSSRPRFPA